ncbi:FAS1 domain-containing protein [Venturia nashicola]|uniref:FAS1 domain-containing protein n=1 Tax=Venturia nashicola TaxID=86259 RepID=A0A4Z1PLS4_9PEZI|nr:FAS1 domain-containing protein [Venturia nashicola]TLD38749.1 FAS1 domain-containing protein [Venturia nashicola]
MYSKLFSIAALASAASAQGQGLAAILAATQETSQLAALVATLPDVAGQLAGLNNITLLAPSNSAVATLLNSSAGAGLSSNPSLLQAVLTYHVLTGEYPASAVPTSAAFVPTALNNPQYSHVTGGQRLEVVRSGDTVTFTSGLLANSSVTQANIKFTGGVLHVIDHVLTLPQNVSSTLVNAGLSSLYGALNATGLLDTVNGLQNVTIFAPQNAAFQRVGSALGSASTDTLKAVLTYHVHVGQEPLYSTSLQNGSTLSTLNGVNLNIHTGSNGIFVNSAKVVTPNVLIAGGVVHIIDNVLNPNQTAAASTSAGTGSPAFSDATSASSAPFTSGVATPTAPVGAGAGTGGSNTTKTSTAGAMPMVTGAVGMGALFGAGAVLANI